MNVKLFDTDELIAWKNVPKFVRMLYRPLAKTVDHLGLLYYTESGMRDRLLNAIKEYCPDVLFIYVINAQSLDRVVRQARYLGCKVVMWLGVSPNVVPSGVRRVLREIDCLFLYDPSYIPSCRQLGCRRVEVVPLGVDLEYIDSVSPGSQAESPADVSFIGMIDDYRYQLLSAINDLGLGVWSWNYSRATYPKVAAQYRGETAGDDAIRILKSSRISVNAHRTYEVSGGNYRLFEIPACNVLQLVDNKPAIPNYFKISEEIILYEDASDLRRKTTYFLKNGSERADIVNRARARIVNNHTVRHRFKLMAEIVKTL